MSGKRPKPPRHDPLWARAVQEANEEIGADPGEPVPHTGRRRPDLWDTWWDVVDMLDDDAAKRLDAALRDPLASESLVAALEAWEILEGDPVAAARERHGIKRGKVGVRLRETREALPDGNATAEMVQRIILDAIEIEDGLGIEEAKELKRAARAYDLATRRLRHALARAEKAAPVNGRPHRSSVSARKRLAASLCRTLGGKPDGEFWAIFTAVWKALEGDNPNKPDPPNKQAIAKHLRDLGFK